MSKQDFKVKAPKNYTEFNEVSKLFSILRKTRNLAIYDFIKSCGDQRCYVGEITTHAQKIFNDPTWSQPETSAILKELKAARLVETDKFETYVYYCANTDLFTKYQKLNTKLIEVFENAKNKRGRTQQSPSL